MVSVEDPFVSVVDPLVSIGSFPIAANLSLRSFGLGFTGGGAVRAVAEFDLVKPVAGLGGEGVEAGAAKRDETRII